MQFPTTLKTLKNLEDGFENMDHDFNGVFNIKLFMQIELP
jgi:hypothetical protein